MSADKKTRDAPEAFASKEVAVKFTTRSGLEVTIGRAKMSTRINWAIKRNGYGLLEHSLTVLTAKASGVKKMSVTDTTITEQPEAYAMNEQQSTQLRAADTLLEKGVRVPCAPAPLFLRLFGRRTFHLTLCQPTLATLLMISRLIVGMELTPADFDGMSLARAYTITSEHTRSTLEVMAEAVRGRRTWIPRCLLARWLGRLA